MNLSEWKARLREIEPSLDGRTWVIVHTFDREAAPLHLAVTARLRHRTRKAGMWGSPAMLTALKNAAYEFDECRARSLRGRDGIFRVDRSFRPRNAMMTKLFDQFLDRRGSGAEGIAGALGIDRDRLVPVRLVSHHLRLLGVLGRRRDGDWLILVDCDLSE